MEIQLPLGGNNSRYLIDYQREKIFQFWAMNVHIGNEIAKVQKSRGVSNEEMADAIGTSVRNWTHLKGRNDLAISQLLKISEKLDFNFFDLFIPTVIEEENGLREPVVKYDKNTPRHTINFQVKYPMPAATELGKFIAHVHALAAKFGFEMV